MIKLSLPHLAGKEKEYVNQAIDSTWIVPLGPWVDEFEHRLERFLHAPDVVALSAGTAAIHLGLVMAGVKPGDEVICQDLTFSASCNPITYLGATPVFVDSESDTWNMDPTLLETAIRERYAATGRYPAAIIPVHLYGMPADMSRIMAIASRYGIPVVEDAAEALGSTYEDKFCGTFGKYGALSFNGNKTITTGGGGMLLFMDEELGKQAKHLTTQAKVPHRWEFVHDCVGYNYRMPNINAALGCAQLENLDRYVADKRETAACYAEFFKGKEDITFFTEPADCKSNYWLNAVVLKDKAAQLDFLEYTNDHGVMTRPVWELMNRLPMFEHCETDGLENTEWLADRVVNIPSSVRLEN